MEIIALLWKVAMRIKDNEHESLGQGLHDVMEVYLFLTVVKRDLICRIFLLIIQSISKADGLPSLGKKKRALQSPGLSHVTV